MQSSDKRMLLERKSPRSDIYPNSQLFEKLRFKYVSCQFLLSPFQTELKHMLYGQEWANQFLLLRLLESDELWYAGSDLLESGDTRINNYCYKPDYVNGCDALLNKMTVRFTFPPSSQYT